MATTPLPEIHSQVFSDLIELFLGFVGWSVGAEHLFYINIWCLDDVKGLSYIYITSYKGKHSTCRQRPSQASSYPTYLISTIFCISISLILYISSVHRPIFFADKQIRDHARQYLKLLLSSNPCCKIILGVRTDIRSWNKDLLFTTV